MNLRHTRSLAHLGAFAAALAFVAAAGCSHSQVSPGGSPGTTSTRKYRPMTLPPHVLTWIGLSQNGQYSQGDWSAAAPYVTFTRVQEGQGAASDSDNVNNAGITPVAYTDPNRQFADNQNIPNFIYKDAIDDDGREREIAHDAQGNRVLIDKNNQTTIEYLMNPYQHTNLAQDWWEEADQFVLAQPNGFGGVAKWIFEDTSDSTSYAETAPAPFSTPDWTANTNSMNTDFMNDVKSHSETAGINGIIFNGLDPGNQNVPPEPFKTLVSTSGGLAENCYLKVANQNPPQAVTGDPWIALETEEIQIPPKFFVCHVNGQTAPANTIAGLRIFAYASFLLTYDINSSIISEDFQVSSGRAGMQVYPESQFVVGSPMIPTPSAIADLAVPGSPHLYTRVYNSCYSANVLLGSCMIVVNSDPSAVYINEWPLQYDETLSVTGGGTLGDGQLKVNAGAPSSTINPGTAIIAIAPASP